MLHPALISRPLPEPRRRQTMVSVGRVTLYASHRPDVPSGAGVARGHGFVDVTVGHSCVGLCRR